MSVPKKADGRSRGQLRVRRPNTIPPLDRLAVDVRTAGDLIGKGVTSVYAMLASGELTSIKDGGSRLVIVTSIKDYLARKIAEGQADTADPPPAPDPTPPVVEASAPKRGRPRKAQPECISEKVPR
jgi:hypothetical protein